MEAGHLVREAREHGHLTQGQLAARAGTAQSAVSRIETGKVSPTVRTLAHLIDLAGGELQMRVVPRGNRRRTKERDRA